MYVVYGKPVDNHKYENVHMAIFSAYEGIISITYLISVEISSDSMNN